MVISLGLNRIISESKRLIPINKELIYPEIKLSEPNKILIIGGGGNKVGNINSSLEVLQSDLLSKFNFEQVGLAGHPEGHPDISDNILDKAVIEKNQFAKKC